MLKKLWKKWRLDKPTAATMDGWFDWRKENKGKYPVRYFLQETLPRKVKLWYNKIIGWPVSKHYWGFKYRFMPQHRYHFINTGLKPNYYEIDTRMLHGCFNMFKEFYEYQISDGHIDWNADEEHRDLLKEMTELYDWWLWYANEDTRKKKLKEPPELPDDKDNLYYILSERERDNPAVQAWRVVLDENRKIEDEWKKQEEEMLVRLIKIRRALWD